MTWHLCILAAYLIGSIPFGLLIGFARGIDIRQHGSKNIGATNAGRVLGRPWGYLCFTLDVLKGALSVFIAGSLNGLFARGALDARDAWLWIAVAAAAVLGHMHSIFLKFKGGKGVATGFGVMLGLWPHLTWPALIALALWLLVARASRYVSLASCIAALSIPVSTATIGLVSALMRGLSPVEQVRELWPFLVLTVALAALVVFKHRANLARLRAGTENRIGAPRS